MGNDIWAVVEEFKNKKRFVREMNHTMIVLIPKKQECESMMDYRPISLCNTIYKIISKVMANRLKKILSKLVVDNQNCFIPGREIADNIILVSEMIHSMHKEKRRGMAIKLDVSKAYDRVIWNFLLQVLVCMGFNSKWIECIKFCISSVSFSILVNGSVCGFFDATNGLRQGDPLSPSLFVLMAEVLGSRIKRICRLGRWKGIYVYSQFEPITHSQFTDDTLLFREATMQKVSTIKSVLEEYSKASG